MINPEKPNYASTPCGQGRPTSWYAPEAGDRPPVLTVVTPFYNGSGVFHETARCVFGQSLQNWEWLIVNDGSTDVRSLEILNEYRTGDARVRVLDHEANRGLSAARNTGYREARTEFVFQLDGDDLIEPTTLEKCLWFLLTHPDCAFVKGFTVGFGADEYLWLNGFHDGARMLEENMVTATALVRRSVHKEVDGYSETNRGGMEDWEFWLRCASKGHWGATVPEYLDWYRRRDGHWGAWGNISDQDGRRAFVGRLRQELPKLWEGGFPSRARSAPRYDGVRIDPRICNPLAKTESTKRLLMILPDMTTSRIRDSVLQLVQSVSTSWEETIVSTNCDPSVTHLFSRYTSDVFALDRFLEPRDVPGFLRYLIESRRPDVVLLNSELACLMVPFLRAMCPDPLYVSCCLADDGQLEDDGNARCSVVSRDQLDLILVSSDRLGDWMTARGVDGARIEVCRAYGSLSPTMDHMEGLFTKARRLKDRQPLPIVDPDLARDIAVRTVEYMRVASLVELLSQERDALRKALKAIDERRPTDVTDPNVVAQSIIEGTLRYRVSDRLNDFLKGLRLQAPIKTIMKALIARDK